jgi:hypothetical protein
MDALENRYISCACCKLNQSSLDALSSHSTDYIILAHIYKEDSTIMGSQDSVITIVTRLWDGQAGNHGSIAGGGKRFFFSFNIQRDWSPPSLLINVYQGVFPGGRGNADMA